MAGYKVLLKTKTKYLLGLTVLLFLTLLCAAFSMAGTDDFDTARKELLFRKIGHEVLLHSGDSTSRVLPVKKIAENEYRIRFENEFSFQPDSLEKIISRTLAKEKIADDYIVNVLNCTGKEVIYGYAIFKNSKDNIVACAGRNQPKNCYLIELKFKSSGITLPQKGYLLGGIPLLAFIGLIISKSVKSRKEVAESNDTDVDHYKLGDDTVFYHEKKQLINNQTITELTAKENKLLLIFAQSPNEIVERSRLQKELWEGEGVIVGRSLDMFISKLRKKLENNPSIQLINIHGKGYKLEIK